VPSDVPTTTEASRVVTPHPEVNPEVKTSVTTMCTAMEVTTMEATSPTTPVPTTEIPYHAIQCQRRDPVDSQFGDVHIKRVARQSKFLHLEYNNRWNTSYTGTKGECERWGLDMAEIKQQLDLKTLEGFLGTHADGTTNMDLAYWVSGSDQLRDGNWKLVTDEPLKFQNFWGMAPLYLTTNTENPEPASLLLRWQPDEETKKPKLFMLDANANDAFYQKKGILCQFPGSNTDCFQKSTEEIKYNSDWIKRDYPDEIGFLKGQNHYVFSNKFQKTRAEAVEFCKSNEMELLDIQSLDATDTEDLFSYFYEHAGKYGAFWIGHNDIFHEKSTLAWDWVNNRMAKPWEDAILKQGSAVPEGRPRAVGKCLVLGTIDDKEPRFYLQHSPCELPQYVLCTEPHVNLG